VTVILRNAIVIQEEGKHVARLGVVRVKVPDAPPLLDVATGVGLEGVDQIGEGDAVADEENGHIIPHQIPITFPCIELHGETAWVTKRFGRTPLVDDRRKTSSYGRFHPFLAKKISAGEVRDIVSHLYWRKQSESESHFGDWKKIGKSPFPPIIAHGQGAE
jgi:hypothetical protein